MVSQICRLEEEKNCVGLCHRLAGQGKKEKRKSKNETEWRPESPLTKYDKIPGIGLYKKWFHSVVLLLQKLNLVRPYCYIENLASDLMVHNFFKYVAQGCGRERGCDNGQYKSGLGTFTNTRKKRNELRVMLLWTSERQLFSQLMNHHNKLRLQFCLAWKFSYILMRRGKGGT